MAAPDTSGRPAAQQASLHGIRWQAVCIVRCSPFQTSPAHIEMARLSKTEQRAQDVAQDKQQAAMICQQNIYMHAYMARYMQLLGLWD